ncbi:MAG TPA: D-alanyl-D-alanine carboxypeptidase [Oligoflexia bacterium]|nr:D-alanyl-D-alanine carboxypeptidase [Oligoflexia bacterium]HMP49152.1 D-alanyl-D-alanine carboxypeptidase [Oligoflexia bacterium]
MLFLVVSFYSVNALADIRNNKNSNNNKKPVIITSPIDADLSKINGAESRYKPASIIKIATASYALFTFGENYRFITKFLVTPNDDLVIQGFGDPGFTSSDLEAALREVKKMRSRFNRLILNGNFYSGSLHVPGRGSSNNPYDAPVSALSINYNTISILKKSNGVIETGELETPLTSFAKSLGHSLPVGKHRVSVGRDSSLGYQQLSELVKIIFRNNGGQIGDIVLISSNPPGSKLLFEYDSSKSVKEYVKDMLEYSNNFIANQLFFSASAYYQGPPVTYSKAQESFRKFLERELGFGTDFVIEEGAGLSHNNNLSTLQALKMLKYFYPYRDLLPAETGLYYKSGTLTGVSNLAGYYDHSRPMISSTNNQEKMFLLFDTSPSSVPDRVKTVQTHLMRTN